MFEQNIAASIKADEQKLNNITHYEGYYEVSIERSMIECDL